jgi:hypothetical protein
MKRSLIPYYVSRGLLSALFGYLISSTLGFAAGAVMAILMFLAFVSGRHEFAPVPPPAGSKRKRDPRPIGGCLGGPGRADICGIGRCLALAQPTVRRRLVGDRRGGHRVLRRQQLAFRSSLAAALQALPEWPGITGQRRAVRLVDGEDRFNPPQAVERSRS